MHIHLIYDPFSHAIDGKSIVVERIMIVCVIVLYNESVAMSNEIFRLNCALSDASFLFFLFLYRH